MSAFDEMVNGRGGVRSHWRPVLGVLAGLDAAQLRVRADRLERTAEEEGAAPSWRCDPVPLPIDYREWAALETGLCQRARLLEALLADIYGPQAMLRDGVLPPAMVFANPGFLRTCRTTPFAAAPFLQNYAVDMVRGADGRWRVLADRTSAAPGIGYARESRRLLARVMPELFRPAQVRQLRPFFDAWQDALLNTIHATERTPFVALLTPGVSDPQWPEHLTLSRDLNCALVQSRDLTVRAGTLFLKTLRGLQKVDLLLSRVPGGMLDPLESSGYGPGVTGLMDAVRHGAVRILNHPGAAAVEAPALAAFLPAICRRLLGEALLLPTTPTIWLGDEGAQRTAAQGFTRWSIRSALDPNRPPRALADMRVPDRMLLEQSIRTRPWAYAACTVAEPSLAPCHGPSGLDARPVVVRLFLMHDGMEWRVMQGGLARVLERGEHVTGTLPEGALFKDVWVLDQDTQDLRGPEPARLPPVAIRRSSGDLPSRVADDFYWLGRYVERLDQQARLCRAGLLRRARGAPLPREVVELDVLQSCIEVAGLELEDRAGSVDELVREALKPSGALAHGLSRATELTEALRDRLTIETYSAFAHALRAAKSDIEPALEAGVDGMVHSMTGLARFAATISGVSAEGMVRGGGWLFLDLGRRLERARVSTLVLANLLEQPPSRMESTLRVILELFDSAITYRTRYMSVLQPAAALDLVMADRGNPRSLAYQFERMARRLDEAGADELDLAGSAIHLLHQTETLVQGLVDAADPDQSAAALAGDLGVLADEIGRLSDRITRRFFALLPAAQAVGLEMA